jgi:hypothetical protein
MSAESHDVEGVTICSYCHGPVAYLDTRFGRMEAVCDECARRDSAHDAGAAAGAAAVLVAAVKVAGDAGLALVEILAAVETAFEGRWEDDDLFTMTNHLPRWASTKFEDDTRFVPLDGGRS